MRGPIIGCRMLTFCVFFSLFANCLVLPTGPTCLQLSIFDFFSLPQPAGHKQAPQIRLYLWGELRTGNSRQPSCIVLFIHTHTHTHTHTHSTIYTHTHSHTHSHTHTYTHTHTTVGGAASYCSNTEHAEPIKPHRCSGHSIQLDCQTCHSPVREMTCHLGICRRRKRRKAILRETEGRKEKKKSNGNCKSVCSSSFSTPTPTPLIVPVLSRFDFSKAMTSLSISLSFSFVQQSTLFFSLPVLSLARRSANQMGAPTFLSGLFTQTIVLSGRIFANNFRKHVFGHPRLKGSLLFGFFLIHHSCFLSNLLSFTFLKRHY